jgi:hypothetical protein
MQALGAAFLEQNFEEGEEFLLYSWQSKSVAGGPLERVVARVLSTDIRGVLYASNDLMRSLAGQSVTSLTLRQSMDASAGAGVVDLRVAFLHTKFLHFVVVVSGAVAAPVAEVRGAFSLGAGNGVVREFGWGGAGRQWGGVGQWDAISATRCPPLRVIVGAPPLWVGCMGW